MRWFAVWIWVMILSCLSRQSRPMLISLAVDKALAKRSHGRYLCHAGSCYRKSVAGGCKNARVVIIIVANVRAQS